MVVDPLISWSKIAWFAAFSFLIAHLFMYSIRKHARMHSLVVYLFALLGGIALFLSIDQSNVQIAKWVEPTVETQRQSTLSWLKQQLKWQREYYCGTKFVRSEFSPPDFDEIVNDQKEICSITKKILNRSKTWEHADSDISLPELRSSAFERKVNKDSADSLLEIASSYNEIAAQLRKLRAIGQPSAAIYTLSVISRYILILSFSIGLAAIMFPVHGNQLHGRRHV